MKTCSALRIAVGLFNQLILMLLVQKGIYETDCAAYQQTTHANNHTALPFNSHLQNNMGATKCGLVTVMEAEDIDVIFTTKCWFSGLVIGLCNLSI